MLSRREDEEEEEEDDDTDGDDVELTEEEVRAFREYRRTEELHARLGFALTDKALSPMRGDAPERRRNPNASSSSPNSAGKPKKSSPATEADRAARAARAVLADMAAANKSLLDAAAASPDAFRLTRERTRRVMRDIGLAPSDEAADEIIEMTSGSGSASASGRKKKGDGDGDWDGDEKSAPGDGHGDEESAPGDVDEDGDPAWYDEDDPAWSMDVEAKLAAIAAAREEARVRREHLERLMGDAEARMGEARRTSPGARTWTRRSRHSRRRRRRGSGSLKSWASGDAGKRVVFTKKNPRLGGRVRNPSRLSAGPTRTRPSRGWSARLQSLKRSVR